MKMPFVILFARERAEAFRRYVELFRTHFGDHPPEEAWEELWRILGEFTGQPSFDRALRWANSSPPPPRESLRAGREIVEAAAKTWFESWTVIGQVLKDNESGHRWQPWVLESVSLALTEKRRVAQVIAECWPVEPADDELRAVAEMKTGESLDLDDAFAGIAGVTKEAWLERVAQHKSRHRPDEKAG